jgi:hypothetical protein
MSQDIRECTEYDLNSFKGCIEGNNQEKNPENRFMNQEQLDSDTIEHCCKLEMTCKNPNKILKNGGYPRYNCAPPEPNPESVKPHFGDVKMSSQHHAILKEKLYSGVY